MSPHWGPKGKFFKGIAALKNSFRRTVPRSWQKNWPSGGSELELEVYELVPVRTEPFPT